MSDLPTVRVRAPYIHQGERMHPKLLYAVPRAVHDGLLALGVAEAAEGEPDAALPHLTWDAATRLCEGHVAPAPLGHEHG